MPVEQIQGEAGQGQSSLGGVEGGEDGRVDGDSSQAFAHSRQSGIPSESAVTAGFPHPSHRSSSSFVVIPVSGREGDAGTGLDICFLRIGSTLTSPRTSAAPPTVFVGIGVRRRELVSSDTMRLADELIGRSASARVPITGVIEIRPDIQVSWIDARAVVAVVQHQEPRWDGSVV